MKNKIYFYINIFNGALDVQILPVVAKLNNQFFQQTYFIKIIFTFKNNILSFQLEKKYGGFAPGICDWGAKAAEKMGSEVRSEPLERLDPP